MFKFLKKIMNNEEVSSNNDAYSLHRITNITGSIFLSLCVLKKDISKNEVIELSFLDEFWQAENWGFDEETSQKRKKIFIELNKSIFFLDCL